MYALGIKLLDGPAEVQHFPIEDILPSMEWRPQVAIAAACVADPYVLLHFSDGSAVLLSGNEEEGEKAEWPLALPGLLCGAKATTCTADLRRAAAWMSARRSCLAVCVDEGEGLTHHEKAC